MTEMVEAEERKLSERDKAVKEEEDRRKKEQQQHGNKGRGS
jgi:hypothetical protein